LYIVGNWKGFNGFMISAIITIIGVTFMGGSLIQLRNSKPFDGDSNPKPKLDEEYATGISLYIKFLMKGEPAFHHLIGVMISF
jgi:hypothetical protein